MTEYNIKKLHNEWNIHWDLDKPFLLEKSPVNIVKTKFLQKIFPNSYFIILLRHPIPVSYATQKWSKTSIINLLEHWIKCHEILFQDLFKIKNKHVVYYENIFKKNSNELEKISNFLEIQNNYILNYPIDEVDYNKKYFDKFNIFEKIKLLFLEIKIKKFGYDLNIHLDTK